MTARLPARDPEAVKETPVPPTEEIIQVCMKRASLDIIARHPAPSGFSFRMFRQGDEQTWTDIWVQAEKYLKQQGVSLETTREFVDRAFLLTEVLRDLLDEAQTDAITINACMSTIMPISETTACLPLSLLNDEGYLAFCESDFVVIPAGILLHYISGTPVFFGNPSLPHRGIVTVSHCTAPARMDGKRPELMRIVTHYESDFGAAPKVDMKKGQRITVINADFNSRRWLGFEAEILDTPFYPICRTQLDLRILGDWERLLDEVKGFHWMVAYGSHLRESGYALKKAGIGWFAVT
jgi:hypothetical protein